MITRNTKIKELQKRAEERKRKYNFYKNETNAEIETDDITENQFAKDLIPLIYQQIGESNNEKEVII